MIKPSTDLSFLLDRFRADVPGVSHALAVSADGLVIAKTGGMDTDNADRLAAVACGLTSLLSSAAMMLEAGQVVSNLTELGRGYLFSMAVSSGASLFVLAGRSADLGTVSYEMAELINRVGAALTPAARDAVGALIAGRRST